MQLTSADTKIPSNHEELTSNNSGNNHDDDESLLSASHDEETTRSSLAEASTPADSVDSPPATDTGARQAGGNSKSSPDGRELTGASACAVVEAPQPLTQLSVSAEENSAFKSYINAQEDDDEPPAGHRSNSSSSVTDQFNWPPLRADDASAEATTTAPLLSGSPSRATSVTSPERPATTVEIRLLVRRREAGALIGKKGANIKRLRETFRGSMFSIPDTGNGPERVVCITGDPHSIDPILADITRLLVEKSPANDEQVELKLLIHSSHAGSIIGIGGQSIKKLRNESKAAIKIYEMCCPLSNERVCAIKARPPVVVSTIKLIQSILQENQIKGTTKPYDALHFDLSLVDKYGGYLPDEPMDLFSTSGSGHTFAAAAAAAAAAAFAHHESAAFHSQKHYGGPGWGSSSHHVDGCCDPSCDMMHSQLESQHAHKQLLSSPESFRRMPAATIQQQPAPEAKDGALTDQGIESTNAIRGGNKFHDHHRAHHPIDRSARFHPYASIISNGNGNSNNGNKSNSNGGSYPSQNPYHHQHQHQHPNHQRPGPRHPSPSVPQQYPSAFPVGALIAAAGAGREFSRAPPTYPSVPPAGHQLRQHRFAGRASAHHHLVYPNDGAGPATGCRHLRPCICMFLPMMQESHHQQHQHYQSVLAAAYTNQVPPHESGEEFHRAALAATEQPQLETSSSNGSSDNNNHNGNTNK